MTNVRTRKRRIPFRLVPSWLLFRNTIMTIVFVRHVINCYLKNECETRDFWDARNPACVFDFNFVESVWRAPFFSDVVFRDDNNNSQYKFGETGPKTSGAGLIQLSREIRIEGRRAL